VLPAVHRLHRQDYAQIYQNGDRFSSKFFKLRRWLIPSNQQPPAKIGIVVSKKVAKLSVKRNQLKRQVRAILRPYLPQLKRGLQIIVTVATVADAPDFSDLAKDLHTLLSKAKVLEVSNGN
jgi:ribonuclease P protein component